MCGSIFTVYEEVVLSVERHHGPAGSDLGGCRFHAVMRPDTKRSDGKHAVISTVRLQKCKTIRTTTRSISEYVHIPRNSFDGHRRQQDLEMCTVYSLEYDIPNMFFSPHHVDHCCTNVIQSHCWNNVVSGHLHNYVPTQAIVIRAPIVAQKWLPTTSGLTEPKNERQKDRHWTSPQGALRSRQSVKDT